MKTPTKKNLRLSQTPSNSQLKSQLKSQFGGALLKGNANMPRPLTTKEALYLVLKSDVALGKKSMLQAYNAEKIEEIVRNHAQRCRVQVLNFVNAGSHLHLLVKIENRALFLKFIRSVTGLIARHVLKVQRGKSLATLAAQPSARQTAPQRQRIQFWAGRPFTRVISKGTDLKQTTQYLKQNRQVAKQTFVPWGFDCTDPMMIHSLSTEKS